MRAGRDSPHFRSALVGSRPSAALAAVGLALGVSFRATDSLASRPLFFLNSGVMVFAAGAVIAGSVSRSTRLAILNGALFLLAAVAGYYLAFRFGPRVLQRILAAATHRSHVGRARGTWWRRSRVGRSLARREHPMDRRHGHSAPSRASARRIARVCPRGPYQRRNRSRARDGVIRRLAWRCDRCTRRLVATLAVLVVIAGGFTLVFVAALRTAY